MLLSLRGKAQLDTSLGRRLFRDLRAQILSRCFLVRSAIPEPLMELSRECQKCDPDPSDSLFVIASDLCQLKSERQFRPQPSDPEFVDRDIVDRCASLTARLEAWGLSLPWSSQIIPTKRNPEDVVSHASDAALLADHYRRLTILVHELELTRLLHLDRQQSLAPSDLSRICDLRSDIVSHVNALSAVLPFMLNTRRIEVGLSVVWTLYVVAQLNQAIIDPDTTARDWIVGQLKSAGSGLGLGQACFLADVLIKRQEVTDLLKDDQSGGQDESDH